MELVRSRRRPERAEVLFEIEHVLGAGYGYDVPALRQDPGERQLGRRAADLLRQGILSAFIRIECMGLPVETITIEQRIYLACGHRVMLDADLAQLYGVRTKELNKAVKRNPGRFPKDFAFQLTPDAAESLRFQIGTSKKGRGGRRYLPYAFTEQGVAMLSSVLHSERAVLVNVTIMRAFVRLRQMLGANRELAQRLNELEKKYDAQFRVVFDAIRGLMDPPAPPLRRIGFHAD